MDIDASTTPASRSTWLTMALGVAAVTSCAWAWALSGEMRHLAAALGFAALMPAWYLRPISFSAPLIDELKRRREPAPKWAQGLSLVGALLVVLSVLLRLTA